MGVDIPRNKGYVEFSQLMWDNKKKLQADLSNDKKSIKLWLDDEGYLPEGVFNGWFEIAAKLATKKDNEHPASPKDAISIFCQVKAEILQLIIAINFLASENNIEKPDYSDILSSIDSFISWATAQLDSELKENQIKVNISLKWAALVTAFLTLVIAFGTIWPICKDALSKQSQTKSKDQLIEQKTESPQSQGLLQNTMNR